jgi:hypothetical protein
MFQTSTAAAVCRRFSCGDLVFNLAAQGRHALCSCAVECEGFNFMVAIVVDIHIITTAVAVIK